jgi:hypothetical protein
MTTRFNTRYIRPEHIKTGDLIRVGWGNSDVKESIMGRVTAISLFEGNTEWWTDGGALLLQRNNAGSSHPADKPGVKVTVALLDRPETSVAVPLSGLGSATND